MLQGFANKQLCVRTDHAVNHEICPPHEQMRDKVYFLLMTFFVRHTVRLNRNSKVDGVNCLTSELNLGFKV